MNHVALHFVLGPSLIKLLVRLILLILLGYLLLQTLSAIFVLLILVAMLIIDLRFLPSNPILAISYLDEKDWIVQTKNSRSNMILTHCFVNMYFAVLFFKDEINQSKHIIYVFRDQLALNHWKQLKNYINLHR